MESNGHPGLRASWINGWLAAVGATVLDDRIRLHWTADARPMAVFSTVDAIDPVSALVESWPRDALLADLPIARDWSGAGTLERRVHVDDFTKRARAARGHPFAWTLSSTMTDLCVSKDGLVEHAPLDPAGPGTIKWLHHRLLRVQKLLDSPPSTTRIRESLDGRSKRIRDNGLGFDQTRLGSMSDATSILIDPVIEVLAFFGLRLLPVRGFGVDGRINRSVGVRPRQRGWRKLPSNPKLRRFCWPAWHSPLDFSGIDALMDAWNPARKASWSLLGVHAGWLSVRYDPRGSADSTRAIGAERL